jgi:hypothetical protein
MFRSLLFFISLGVTMNSYITHYNDSIYALSLDNETPITIASSLKTCGDAPS